MRVLVACTLLLLAMPLAAQRPLPFPQDGPVAEGSLDTRHLRAEVVGETRMAADGTGSVTLVITPAPGMHIYAPDAEGYAPFRVEFEPRADLTGGSHAYPASELSIFPPTGETSRVYTKPFRVVRGFTVKGRLRDKIRASADGMPITLLVRYQACDDRVCYRSEQRSLVVRVRAR